MKKTKIILGLVVIFAMLFLLNGNKVFAAYPVGASDDVILDDYFAFNDPIEIDITEFEAIQATEEGVTKGDIILKQKIDEILKDATDLENKEYSVYIAWYEDFKVAKFEALNGTYKKDLKIKYSNSDQYNKTDADEISTKCKNIKFSANVQFDITENYASINNKLYKAAHEGFKELIDGSDLQLYYREQFGDISYFGTFCAGTVFVAKNDIIYYVGEGGVSGTPVITVPLEVEPTTEAYIEYITQVVKELPNNQESEFKIIKGEKENEYLHVNKGYSYDGELIDISYPIIVKPENKVEVDTATNIKLNAEPGVIPVDTVMVVEEISTESKTYTDIKETLTTKKNTKKFKLFDINLTSQGVKIQPNGKVKINIPIPTEFDATKLVVYRIEDNLNTIEYETKIIEENNVKYAQFEADHFSNYVLAEKEETPVKVEKEETTVKVEKDESPKMGVDNTYLILATVISIVSIVGIVYVIKRK